jgi:hypothetical protein
MEGIPVFDFHTPWVALIQLALVYFLPRLTGLVTDRFSASGTKITVLGVLSVLGSALTWLLDVAMANSWASLDWVTLVNVIVNAALTFAIAQGVFKGVIVPLGQADRDADNTTIKLFGPSSPQPVGAPQMNGGAK